MSLQYSYLKETGLHIFQQSLYLSRFNRHHTLLFKGLQSTVAYVGCYIILA